MRLPRADSHQRPGVNGGRVVLCRYFTSDLKQSRRPMSEGSRVHLVAATATLPTLLTAESAAEQERLRVVEVYPRRGGLGTTPGWSPGPLRRWKEQRVDEVDDQRSGQAPR